MIIHWGKLILSVQETFRNLLTVIARLESPPDILFHGFCFGVTEKYVCSMPHGVPERPRKARKSESSVPLAAVWFGHETSLCAGLPGLPWQLLKTGNRTLSCWL